MTINDTSLKAVTDFITGAARAIRAHPEDLVGVLTRSNTFCCWLPLDQAVAQGLPFFVTVADDVVAVDADSVEEGRTAELLGERLTEAGFRPVITCSGRSGHRHLFVRIPDGPSRWRWKEEARQLGLDVRVAIRPPLAPHREGLDVRLVNCGMDEALDRLGASPEPLTPEPVHPTPLTSLRHVVPRDLSPMPQRLLELGDAESRYASRSEVDAATALAAVQAGWSYEHWQSRVLAGDVVGSLKAKEMVAESRGAESYLRRTWANAERFAEENPARTPFFEELSAAVAEAAWPERHMGTARKLLEAHLALAETLGAKGLKGYDLSHRDAAERAGLSVGTVCKASDTLERLGWLVLISSEPTSRWKLKIPHARGTDTNALTPCTLLPPDFVPEARRCPPFRDCMDLPIGHDLFRTGGVDRKLMQLMQGMEGPAHVAQLAGALRRPLPTVRRHLRRALDVGLVAEVDGRPKAWKLAEPLSHDRLDAAAAQLGLAGIGQKQAERHARERVNFERGKRVEPFPGVTRGQVGLLPFVLDGPA